APDRPCRQRARSPRRAGRTGQGLPASRAGWPGRGDRVASGARQLEDLDHARSDLLAGGQGPRAAIDMILERFFSRTLDEASLIRQPQATRALSDSRAIGTDRYAGASATFSRASRKI